MRALAFSGGKDAMACLHLERGRLDCAIYVDTGLSYPETRKLVEYAAEIVPMHVVYSDRRGQNRREGIPADVVPIDWSRFGQQVSETKRVMVQSYLNCCFENISAPILAKAKELGVTELVYGQRNDEAHKSTARDGSVVDGITRRHPIETWTQEDVMAYLRTKMEIPEHYAIGHSSLDCYDCTAYHRWSADRIDWTRLKHPDFYERYLERRIGLMTALEEAM